MLGQQTSARLGRLGRFVAVLVALLPAAAAATGSEAGIASEGGAPLAAWGVERHAAEGGLPGGRITALAADAGGWLWVGTDRGLARFDGRRFRPVPLDGDEAPTVYALAEGAGAELFAATSRGVARIDRATLTHEWLALSSGPEPATALAYDLVSGGLWIGTPQGVLRWQRGRVHGRYGAAEGLPADAVYALAIDPFGELLVATAGGVARFDGRQFTPISDVFGRTLAVASRGALRMVVAGDGAAVEIVDGRAARTLVAARPFDAEAVLARAAWIDDDGALWLAGDRLARLRPGAAMLDFAAGHLPGRLWAICADRAGGLWLGGDEGLVHLVPPTPLLPPTPPEVRLERIEIDGEPIPLAAGSRGGLELPAAATVELFFAAGGAPAAAELRLRHRLIGADGGWTDPGESRSARYRDLEPGDYRFEVAAAFRDGPFGAPAEVALAVPPRWFDRLPARLAGALALLLAAFALVRWRLGSLRRRQAELEAEVATRTAQLARLNDELADRVAAQTAELRQTRDQALLTLARLAELRDGTTGEHLDRIAWFSRRLAEALARGPFGPLGEDYIEEIFRSSPLHDIGKVAIPDSILSKPGALDDRERQIMESHTLIGGDTLRGVIARSPGQSFLAMGMEIAYAHHERWDGRGYPSQLAGDDIPLAARIVALVDAYDAITGERPYKPAISHDEAVRRILADAGTHFDPRLTDAFRRIHEDLDRIRRDHPTTGL